MSKRNNKQSQQSNGVSNAADTEFGAELSQSKKAWKKAARENKNNS
jgi:hypothetical protein